MTASRYVDIWCDGKDCGKWEENATDHTAAGARRKAKSYGWEVSLPGGRDLCPSCAALSRTEADG